MMSPRARSSTLESTVSTDRASAATITVALRNADSALVSGSDPKELTTVRDGFAAKKLGLAAEAADTGIAKVLEQLKGVNRKNRVTFYYLLAQATGTLDKLA